MPTLPVITMLQVASYDHVRQGEDSNEKVRQSMMSVRLLEVERDGALRSDIIVQRSEKLARQLNEGTYVA